MCKKHVRVSMNNVPTMIITDDNLRDAVNQAPAISRAHGKNADLFLYPQDIWLGTSDANGQLNLTAIAKKL